MAQAERQGLPTVGSRKELEEQLERMNTPCQRPGTAREKRRPRGKKADRLKTYILEAGSLVQNSVGSAVSWEIGACEYRPVKILRIWQNDSPEDIYEFYLDKKDPRFLVLHTDENGTQANRMIKSMVAEPGHSFDHAWFYTGMLQKWTREKGGRDGHYEIEHHGGLRGNPVRLRIDGTGTREIYDRLLEMEAVGARASQKAIEIQSAGRDGMGRVMEHITNTGCFTTRPGASIGDHLHVVEECKGEYRGVISRVEEDMLGTADGGGGLKGRPFVLRFQKKIPDLERFIDWMFNSGEPFRLWGTRWEISEGYYSVVGVDMHEGSPVNFEVADDMMRVYLYEGSCGNTLARILTNLQLGYDAGVRCAELEL